MTGDGRYRYGFDIGGTFTDFVLVDVSTGRIETYKTPTTPHNPTQAVIEGWHTLLERIGDEAEAVETAIHATTLITNALVERKGAEALLVTTEGFKDSLDTQREMRYDIYDLHSPPVQALIPRTRRVEVKERLDSFGDVYQPLDEKSVEELVNYLRDVDVEAVAVCFLHSYKNPAHEQRVGEVLAQEFPELYVTLSSDVAPEIREYERMSTAVANAFVQPLAGRYITQMENSLEDAGYQRRVYLMLSSGGITVSETAAQFPIRMVESGPAAGVLASVFYGEQLNIKNLVSFDMGGTTAKMCLVKDGVPSMAHTFEIARVHRFKRGSGLPVRIPAIELIEIGAGGGSIARVDEMGLLKVGPDSAGADPGPTCYGFGGNQPTVTDADLILGYLNPDYFLGGRMTLDTEAAARAIEPLARRLGLSVPEAAWGIHQIVNENMVSATRVHIAEHGEDPRRLTLLAFGGAGPLHAYQIARSLKMQGYVCPNSAGVTSALGLLTAPAAFDFAQTFAARVTPERLADLDVIFANLEAEGRQRLVEAGVPESDMRFERSADMRHRGQGHEIVVNLPWEQLAEVDLEEQLRPHFYSEYEELYGHAHRHLDLEVMTCRLRATGSRPTVTLPKTETTTGDLSSAQKGTRPAYLPEQQGFVDVAIYDWEKLPAGAEIRGPAVVEEKDSTALVGPRATARVDEYLSLIVTFDDNGYR